MWLKRERRVLNRRLRVLTRGTTKYSHVSRVTFVHPTSHSLRWRRLGTWLFFMVLPDGLSVWWCGIYMERKGAKRGHKHLLLHLTFSCVVHGDEPWERSCGEPSCRQVGDPLAYASVKGILKSASPLSRRKLKFASWSLQNCHLLVSLQGPLPWQLLTYFLSIPHGSSLATPSGSRPRLQRPKL